jgi:Nuclear transport factor 2 (NTF2) domain/RNA recognition motif. (a.k.a. RRM, RBD, or RNP domain)
LAIGRTFLKQFYKVLTTNPDLLHKFYMPSSILSHGEGSNPTTPETLESLGSSSTKHLLDRFTSWGGGDTSANPVRIELEHGAIDAQESVNGSILLVVTGHLFLGDLRKPFCHTFFLNDLSSENASRRHYYVHNDVLRFLKDVPTEENESIPQIHEMVEAEDADQVKEDGTAENQVELPTVDEPLVEEEIVTKTVVEDKPEILVEPSLPEGYMEGVEETKEDPEEDNESYSAPRVSSASPKECDIVDPIPPKPKPPLGSWASLVASGGGAVSIRKEAVAVTQIKKRAPKKDASSEISETKPKQEKESKALVEVGASSKPLDLKQRHRRDPDFTLVIKNVQDGVKEADVRAVFEPIALQTNSKIVGITVSQRGLAFVDYDSASPVLAALEKKDSFILNGKQVRIDQKTNDSKHRGRGGQNPSSRPSTNQQNARSNSNGHRHSNASSNNGSARKEGGRREGNGGKGNNSNGGS